ncbi:DUF222 domain-containing protein [Georgenia sp. Z1491]|uniref:HNH endonuclease signature motif containing protein n=1 Tax=Georgenia sp. Z1491 TaxID=3416707 RepID=UPI003CEAEEA8
MPTTTDIGEIDVHRLSSELEDWWDEQALRDWAAEDPLADQDLAALPLREADLQSWMADFLGPDAEHELIGTTGVDADVEPYMSGSTATDPVHRSGEVQDHGEDAGTHSTAVATLDAGPATDALSFDRPGAAACDPVELLTQVAAACDAVTATDWHSFPGERVHQAHQLLEQVERKLSAARAGVLTAAEGNGLWALEGWRTFKAYVRHHAGTSNAAAGRQIAQARTLRDHLPRTATALAEARIGVEHVNVLVREAVTTTELRARLDDDGLGEAFLVAQAEIMHANDFARVVKKWATMADPEAADRAWREADSKEELSISPTLGGYHVNGWLDELSGQVIHTALTAHMGTKNANDTRTPAQRRAAALVSLAHQSLDTGLQSAHARVRPHVTVTVDINTLRGLAAATGSVIPPSTPAESSERARHAVDVTPAATATDGNTGAGYPPGASFGLTTTGTGAGDASWPVTADATLSAPGGPRDPGTDLTIFDLSDEARQWLAAWTPGEDHVISTAIDHQAMTGLEPATLADGTPVPPTLLARLACDSALSRVIFGPESTVLDVGREKRIFPANMTKAIIARDGHCQYPDCSEPPGFGEIHHSLQWYRDNGPTSVEHGILLCWHHHDLVHARNITITRRTGHWHFHARNGHPIEPTTPMALVTDPGPTKNDTTGTRAGAGTDTGTGTGIDATSTRIT